MSLRLLPTLVARIGVLLALAAGVFASPVATADTDVQITVSRNGATFVVDAHLFAPVPPREAWIVLTDFENMSGFVPNLSESRVTRRTENHVTVVQRGVARFGVLRYPFESVREVELRPHETVRSHNVAGNVSKVDSITQLAEAEAGTRVSYHVEIIPGFWFPDFVGEAFIRHEIREQFEAIVKEMVRRQRAGTPQTERLADGDEHGVALEPGERGHATSPST